MRTKTIKPRKEGGTLVISLGNLLIANMEYNVEEQNKVITLRPVGVEENINHPCPICNSMTSGAADLICENCEVFIDETQET